MGGIMAQNYDAEPNRSRPRAIAGNDAGRLVAVLRCFHVETRERARRWWMMAANDLSMCDLDVSDIVQGSF